MGRILRTTVVLVGWAVIVMAVDLGVGSVLGLARGDAPVIEVGGGGGGGGGGGQSESATDGSPCLDDATITPENRDLADDPAVQGPQWNQEYWCEFGQLTGSYVPYLYYRLGDTKSRYINSSHGIRHSYEPAGLDPDAPVVWFFGGSTTWGFAQRDLHTIPSQVARISEQAGTPVRVVNFGQLSWVHWQEMLAFEQELSARSRPDVVVFYDGVNDVAVQTSVDGRPSDDATIYDFGNDPPAPIPAPFTADSPDLEPSLVDRWADNSALWHLGRTIAGFASEGAEASNASATSSSPSGETSARRAADIYQRGEELSLRLARDHDVQPLFFLQPRRGFDTASAAFIERTVEAAPATIDLTHELDGSSSVFLRDSAHTNEDGARLVAEAMWPFVRSAVAARGPRGTGGAGGTGAT